MFTSYIASGTLRGTIDYFRYGLLFFAQGTSGASVHGEQVGRYFSSLGFNIVGNGVVLPYHRESCRIIKDMKLGGDRAL